MIVFELLSEKNVEEMWKLELECFPEDPWSLKMFTAEIDNKISVYIAARDEENGRLAGYGGMWMMYDCADITNIAVSPEYRREGLGSEILSVLEKIAAERGMTSLTLEVRESNFKAIGLYEKNGFIKNGLRKGYYKGKENAVLMIKEISQINEK